MKTSVVQRWRDRRDSYRPAGEPIRTSAYEVAEFGSDTVARGFVERHHYSASYPAARFRFGLHRDAQLVGVAVFSVPVNEKSLAVFPGEPIESIELGRLVLLDDVPANGESWFVARCFEALRSKGLVGVLSLSDPMPREDVTGRRVFVGHVGTVYQALNGVYLGRATKRTLHLLPDGTVFSARAMQKVRKLERGWRYAVDMLLAFGAPQFEGLSREWLTRALAAVTRRARHPGNHRYAWALNRRDRRHLPESQPYPKFSKEAP